MLRLASRVFTRATQRVQFSSFAAAPAARLRFQQSSLLRPMTLLQPQVRFFAADHSHGHGEHHDEHHGHGHGHGPSNYLEKEEIVPRVLGVLASFNKIDKSKLTLNAAFKDLGIDSLDHVELVMAVEEEFGLEFEDDQAVKLNTIKDLVELISVTPFAEANPHH